MSIVCLHLLQSSDIKVLFRWKTKIQQNKIISVGNSLVRKWSSLLSLCPHFDEKWKSTKSKQSREKSLFPVLPLHRFPKVILSISLPLWLFLSPSPFTAWSPSQSLLTPTPLASPFSLQLWQLSVAACQGLCYDRTQHWGLKLSTDVDEDKGRWSI